MECSALFIADHAKMADGLLYVNGGWPEWWTLSEVPEAFSLHLIMVLEFELADLGIEKTVVVTVVDPEGTEVVLAGLIVKCLERDYVQGAPMREVQPLRLDGAFALVGPFNFRLLHDETELARVALGVRLAPPD